MRALPGRPYPLGANWDGLGANFAIYSAFAEQVEVVLFDSADEDEPSSSVLLWHRTGPIWHGFIDKLMPGQLYGYRIYGPYAPERGHRFNPNKVLLDPYARAIGRPMKWDDALYGYRLNHSELDASYSTSDSAAFAPLGAVIDPSFAWSGDSSPRVPPGDTIIYETHVKGISARHPDVPAHLRGTYMGLIADPIIEHLQSLGVTTVQLLPVHAKVHDRRLVDAGLRNYWGYDSLSYFAPEPDYSGGDPIAAVREFKSMVRGLHAAGFEVIIDVVYNHTGEGGTLGPTLSFRGIGNKSYYKENPSAPRLLIDYTGTGNTLDVGNPHVLQLMMDSLRYWVTDMHVDGFRFDLASALARDLYEFNALSSFFQVIQQDPVLSQVKLIAEPWDVGPGGYQVGAFPWQWMEWNGKYRDAIRRFWRGDPNVHGEFASRISGSSDLYEHSERSPSASINFITAHDGFTLEDLVSYEQKHNDANLEENRDGSDANYSRNFGVEGPTQDETILRRRHAAKRALMSTLLLSQGIPMILGGDEICRTQKGNNNAYCHDSELNWYDWDLTEGAHSFLEFVQQIIAFRKAHPNFRRHHFLTGVADMEGVKDILWWHPDGREMTLDDWHDPDGRELGMVLRGDRILDTDARGILRSDATFLVLFNALDLPSTFVLPPHPTDGGGWSAVMATRDAESSAIGGSTLEVPGHSLMVLQALEP